MSVEQPTGPRPERIWAPRLIADRDGDLGAWLLCRAFQDTHEFARTLAPALAELLGDVLSRMEQRVELPEWLFLGLRGTPAFELLAWLGRSWLEAPADDERLRAAAKAMLLAYLAVRAEDDLVDEPWGDTRWVYLIHALHSRARRRMLDAGQHARDLTVELDRQARDYASAAADDAAMRADTNAAWGYDAIELQGAKFLPMAGPLCAFAAGCGRADDIGAIVRTVRGLGIGLQLANDFLWAARDLANGLSSPLLRHLGLVPGRDGEAELFQAMRAAQASGRLRAYLASIRAALLASGEPMKGRADEGYSEHLDQRLAALDEDVDVVLLRALGGAGAGK